jgi:hypothetical protein
MRGNRLSEEAAMNPNTAGHQQLLSITIDCMDQAKFKLPRNISSANALARAWRPQLSVVVVIVHGLIKAYFLLGPDIHKDANMEATVTSRVLHHPGEVLSEAPELLRPQVYCHQCRQHNTRGQTYNLPHVHGPLGECQQNCRQPGGVLQGGSHAQ